MQLMIGMRHECGEGEEMCGHRLRLRDAVQKEGGATGASDARDPCICNVKAEFGIP